MKVRVRGGYGSVRVGGAEYKEKQEFDISPEDYRKRSWVFDVVQPKVQAAPVTPVAAPVATEEKKAEEEAFKNKGVDSEEAHPEPQGAVAAAVAEEDAENRMMDAPTLKRFKRGRK